MAYAYFWGCFIPARFPFIEKSTRMGMGRLGVDVRDIEGFTCCPESSVIRPADERAWLLAASRNLALAETQGFDLITPCNGCYLTLKTVAARLATDARLRAGMNAQLSRVGLALRGRIRVYHLIEFLHDVVGTAQIRSKVRTPLSGFRVAVHYGCHMLRPSSAVGFDDARHPTKFDNLVRALGAESLDYDTKMLCCGGALSPVGSPEEAAALTRTKLVELRDRRADAITLSCPNCMMQYDVGQFQMLRKGEQLGVPVLFYTELLNLAMGVQPEEVGLDMHKVDCTPFTQFLSSQTSPQPDLPGLDMDAVTRCADCGACVHDCPVVRADDQFNPNVVMKRLISGDYEGLLGSPDIWKCVDCYTCTELCPQNFGMDKAFEALRRAAGQRGIRPPGTAAQVSAFAKSARLAEPAEGPRRKLGLPSAPKLAVDELRELLQE
ncbi:MAG: heterodisulfide reductase-related iron-sulfur binding cluster [Armatimonadota bacterium]